MTLEFMEAFSGHPACRVASEDVCSSLEPVPNLNETQRWYGLGKVAEGETLLVDAPNHHEGGELTAEDTSVRERSRQLDPGGVEDEGSVCVDDATWFNVLHLRGGCCQILRSAAVEPKMAFTSSLGFFRSEKMPKGISGAPASFPRGMRKTMGEVKVCGVLTYVNDCLELGFAWGDYEARRVAEPGRPKRSVKCGGVFGRRSLVQCEENDPTYQLNFLVLGQTVVDRGMETQVVNLNETQGREGICTALRSYTDELIQREETMTHLRRDQQKLKTSIQNRLEDLQVGEDQGIVLIKVNRKPRAQGGEFDYTPEEVKKWRTDLGKGRRTLERNLKMTIASLNEVEKLKVDLEDALRKKQPEAEHPLTAAFQVRVEEAGGVTASQIEMARNPESELLRLWRELKESPKKLTSRLQEAEGVAQLSVSVWRNSNSSY
ncbi:uncharacterized protein [Mobula birostris]|uniref:uncharacterized protein n=1 Tax=Mobula birostris TaxID=1983395 RepID=UPI003B28BA98